MYLEMYCTVFSLFTDKNNIGAFLDLSLNLITEKSDSE